MTISNRIHRRLAWCLLAGLITGALAPVAEAAVRRMRINLGTLVPRGSLYHKSLLEMSEAWRKASDGNIRLVIYPDGSQGGESDMTSLIRIGTLHAGLFTGVGLSEIEPGVSGLQTAPMMYRDLKEFEYVTEQMRPEFEQRLAKEGFVVLFWADAGWVRYFSKRPLVHPEDLKRSRVFAWAGSTEQVDMMKKAGYNPVPLETGEIVQALETGLIDALASPPIYALAQQVDTRAPYMLELNWAPLVGAAVISKKTWDQIPRDLQGELAAIAAETGKEIQAKSREENQAAVEAMKKRGLKVQKVDDALEAKWRKAAEAFYPEIRGSLVPADVFDKIQRLLKEYRAGTKASQP